MTAPPPALVPVSFRGHAPAGVRTGDVLTEPAFLSASADPRVATENFSTSSVLAVAGSGGRFLGPTSSVPSEQEVVYGLGTRLRVVATGEVDGLSVTVTVVQGAGPEPDVTGLVRQVIAQVRAARDQPPVALERTGRFTTPVGG